MPFTSKLGTKDSRLNNLKIGDGSNANVLTGDFTDSLTFTDETIGYPAIGKWTDTLVLTDGMTGYTNLLNDLLTFTDSLTPVIDVLAPLTDTLTFTELVINTIYVTFEDDLVLDDEATGISEKIGDFSDAVAFTEDMLRAFVAGRLYGDAVEFAELMSRNISKLLSLSDTLSLTDVITGAAVKVFQDTMTFSDVITGIVAKVFRDTMEFGESMTGTTVLKRTLTDQLIAYDSIAISLYTNLVMSDTLVLSDTLTGSAQRPLFDTVIFSDTITGVASKPMFDTVTFSDSSSYIRTINKSLSDNLNFDDEATCNFVIMRQLTEALDFIEQMKGIRARLVSLSDTVALNDELLREVIQAPFEDDLVLVDDLTYTKHGIRSIDELLTLSDNLQLQTTLTRTVPDYLSFAEGFVVRINRKLPVTGIGQIYAPEFPVGYEGTIPSPVWNGVISVLPQMVMIGATTSIVIPPPEFNDFVANQGKIAVQRSMIGNYRVYRKTTQREKLNWRFLLPKYKADELKAFLLAEIDNEFTVIDWEGSYWKLKILSDSVDFVESGRWAPCGNRVEVTIEFVGYRYV